MINLCCTTATRSATQGMASLLIVSWAKATRGGRGMRDARQDDISSHRSCRVTVRVIESQSFDIHVIPSDAGGNHICTTTSKCIKYSQSMHDTQTNMCMNEYAYSCFRHVLAYISTPTHTYMHTYIQICKGNVKF